MKELRLKLKYKVGDIVKIKSEERLNAWSESCGKIEIDNIFPIIEGQLCRIIEIDDETSNGFLPYRVQPLDCHDEKAYWIASYCIDDDNDLEDLVVNFLDGLDTDYLLRDYINSIMHPSPFEDDCRINNLKKDCKKYILNNYLKKESTPTRVAYTLEELEAKLGEKIVIVKAKGENK